MVQNLEEKKIITRKQHPTNKSAYIIDKTEFGHQFSTTGYEILNKIEKELCAKWGEDKFNQFKEILAQDWEK